MPLSENGPEGVNSAPEAESGQSENAEQRQAAIDQVRSDVEKQQEARDAGDAEQESAGKNAEAELNKQLEGVESERQGAESEEGEDASDEAEKSENEGEESDEGKAKGRLEKALDKLKGDDGEGFLGKLREWIEAVSPALAALLTEIGLFAKKEEEAAEGEAEEGGEGEENGEENKNGKEEQEVEAVAWEDGTREFDFDEVFAPRGAAFSFPKRFNGEGVRPRLSSEFGPREAPKEGASTNHKGVDIAMVEGVPIVATQRLVVVRSFPAVQKPEHGWEAGNSVHLRTEPGGKIFTLRHLKDRPPANGIVFEPGERIARVGSTGNVTGPHIHLELRDELGGEPYDPGNYLPEMA